MKIKKYMEKIREKNGITLIALIVTIIVNLLSYDKKVKYSI